MRLLPNISCFYPEGFQTRLHLPAAAWYEVDQAQAKWNRATGITAALSASTRRTAEIIWRPGGIRGWFLVATQIWDGSKEAKDSTQDTWGVFDVQAGEEIEVKGYINEHELAPVLRGWVTWEIRRNANDQPRLLEQHFKGPWYGVYRQLGPKNISEEAKGKPVVRFDFI